MKLFNVTFADVTFVVAAENAEEIAAHTHAEIVETDDATSQPLTVAQLPKVAAPVSVQDAPAPDLSQGEQEPQSPVN